MQEIWKDVKGYEDIYQVSNMGRVRSLDIVIEARNGRIQYKKGKIMAINRYPNGYCYVNFCVNGKRTSQLVHRLVATAFISNSENKPEVNHKDENILNNRVDNLEWMTSKENANYGTRNKRVGKKLSVKVIKLDKEHNPIKIYNSLIDAGKENNIDISSIIRVCKGRQYTSKGYIWMYYNDYLNMITRREVTA